MRPRELIGRGERHIGPEQGLDRHRGGHAGRPHEPVRIREEQRPDRAHHLRPVEQRQALLGLQGQRRQTRLAKCQQRRQDVPAVLHLAAPDQRQREVGQRRQVARRAEAALLRDDRVDPRGEERQQPVHEQRPAAAVAEGERVRAEQQHGPDDLARERRSDPGRVAHQEVFLELARLLGLDERRREITETGRDAVDDGPLGDECLDDVACLLHALPRVGIERDRGTMTGHGLDVGHGQVRTGQDDLGDLWFGHVAEDSRLCSRPCSTS